MATLAQAKEAYELLTRMLTIPQSVNEQNWIRGIRSAIAHLAEEDGNLDPAGFRYARSNYRTMPQGGVTSRIMQCVARQRRQQRGDRKSSAMACGSSAGC